MSADCRSRFLDEDKTGARALFLEGETPIFAAKAHHASIDKHPAVSLSNIAGAAEGHLPESKNHTIENSISLTCVVFSREVRLTYCCRFCADFRATRVIGSWIVQICVV